MSHQSLFVGNDYEQNIDTSGLSKHVCGSIPKLTFLEFEHCGENFKINIRELF